MSDTTTGIELADVIIKTLGTGDTTGETLIREHTVRRAHRVTISDAATAGTAVAEQSIFRNYLSTGIRVLSCTLTSGIAITGDNTNNAVITLRASLGGTTLGTTTTNVAEGNFVVGTPHTMSVTPAVTASGACVTIQVAKGGTGVALTSATGPFIVEIVYEPV